MSTIEKILESLQKTSRDKKEQLNVSYQEKSVWLKNELDLIKKLIKQNPRDKLGSLSADTNDNLPCLSSNDKAEDKESSRKRKSPETANANKLSPEQKRASVDVEDLIEKAGLPSDLNRMTKEKLLSELEKRGNELFTMKSLKKDLVDALRGTLVEQSRKSVNEAQTSSADCNSSAAAPSAVVGKSTAAGARKGSLMAEFRTLVNSSNGASALAAAATNTAHPSSSAVGNSGTSLASSTNSVQAEFQARQNRHRDSQARKSQIDEAMMKSLNSSGALANAINNNNPNNADSTAKNPANTGQSSDDVTSDAVLDVSASSNLAGTVSSTSDNSSTAISTGAATAESGVWMEVTSPQRTSTASVMSCLTAASSESAAVAAGKVGEEEAGEGQEVMQPPVNEEAVPEDVTVPESKNPQNDAAISATSVATVDSKKDVAPAEKLQTSQPTGQPKKPDALVKATTTATAISAEMKTSTSANNSSALAKSSLVNTTTAVPAAKGAKMTGNSFSANNTSTSNSATANSNVAAAGGKSSTSVIPALEKAKAAKIAEEARMLQKKKEQQARMEAHTAAMEAASQPPMTTTAQITTTTNSASASGTATANSATAVAAPVKKGLFSMFSSSSKKDKEKITANAESSTAVAAGKATSGAGGGSTSTAEIAAMVRKAPLTGPIADTGKAAVASNKPLPSNEQTVNKPGAETGKKASAAAAVGGGSSAVSSSTSSTAGVKLKDAFVSKSMISSIVSNYNNALKAGNSSVHGTTNPSTATVATANPVGSDTSSKIGTLATPSTANATRPVTLTASAATAVTTAVSTSTPAGKQAAALGTGGVLRDITASVVTPSAPMHGHTSTVHSAAAAGAASAGGTTASHATSASSGNHIVRPVANTVANTVEPAAEEYQIEDRESSDDESGTDNDEENANKKKQNVPEWARGAKLKEALERQYGLNGSVPMDPDLIFPEVQKTCSLEEIFGAKEGVNRKYNHRSSSAHWDADELTLVEKRAYRKHMGYDNNHHHHASNHHHLQQQQQHVAHK